MLLRRIIVYGVIFSSARMLVGATSAIYLLSQGLTIGELGALKSLQAAAVFFLDVPTSYFADRFGRKTSVMLSALFSIIWLSMTGLAPDKIWLYVAEVANALSICFSSGAFTAMLVDQYKHENPEGTVRALLGRFGFLQTAGMAVGAIIGAAFFEPTSRWPWLLGAGLLIGQLCVLHASLPSDKPAPREESKAGLTTVQKITAVRAVIYGLPFKAFMIGLLLITVTAFYQILIQFWQVIVAPEPSSAEGLRLGVLFVLILSAQAAASNATARFRSSSIAWATAITGLIMSAVLLRLGAVTLPLLVPVSLVSFFFFLKIGIVSAQAELHEVIPSARRATIESGFTTLMRLVVFILLPLTGYALSYIGDAIIIALCTATVFISSLTLYLLHRSNRNAERDRAQVGLGSD